MDRLNFKLDEFVRLSWPSAEARDKWGPIFSALSNIFISIERASVSHRGVALINCSPDELLNLTKGFVEEGRVVVPVERVNRSSHYQSASGNFDPTKDWDYKVAIVNPALINAADFIHAYEFKEWKEVGYMLGYPKCCREFFETYWVEEKWFDTTLPMCWGTMDYPEFDPFNNILLRVIGLRAVSHLPCSFTCERTRDIAWMYHQVACDLRLKDQWSQLVEILSWPIEWSSLHGIAQIVTPVCKITYASDALPEKKVLRLQSEKYPKESGRGNGFPFVYDNWTANGFTSFETMQAAHVRILAALEPLSPFSVLDLGCGNGRLLREIKREFTCHTTVGVDNDSQKHPDVYSNIYNYTPTEHFEVALIAWQRQEEQPGAFAELFTRLIEGMCDRVLIYDYSTGEIDVYDKESFRSGSKIPWFERSKRDNERASRSRDAQAGQQLGSK